MADDAGSRHQAHGSKAYEPSAHGAVGGRQSGGRRPYVSPRLATYGSIHELTRDLDSGNIDPGFAGTKSGT